jgi:hypothetical protein
MKPLIVTFVVLFTLAAALSGSAGLLVTASLFIADRQPETYEYLWVHLFVSIFFLALGFLLYGIRVQFSGLARIAAEASDETSAKLKIRISRMLILFAIAGAWLCGMLAMITYAILARIDEGFAVFG